jgi:hypothetical protein
MLIENIPNEARGVHFFVDMQPFCKVAMHRESRLIFFVAGTLGIQKGNFIPFKKPHKIFQKLLPLLYHFKI